MRWSSVHRGDFDRMRRGLTIALLEVEVLEAKVQLGYSHEEVPASFAADISLLRLLLERADAVSRRALDITAAQYGKTGYSDRALAG